MSFFFLLSWSLSISISISGRGGDLGNLPPGTLPQDHWQVHLPGRQEQLMIDDDQDHENNWSSRSRSWEQLIIIDLSHRCDYFFSAREQLQCGHCRIWGRWLWLYRPHLCQVNKLPTKVHRCTSTQVHKNTPMLGKHIRIHVCKENKHKSSNYTIFLLVSFS